jgi:hypothetical protein
VSLKNIPSERDNNVKQLQRELFLFVIEFALLMRAGNWCLEVIDSSWKP